MSFRDDGGEAIEQQIGWTRAGGSAAEPTWRHGIPRAGCRRRPSDRRTAQLPTRRGRSRAQARGRAAQGVGQLSRAAAAQWSPCSTRTRSDPGATPPAPSAARLSVEASANARSSSAPSKTPACKLAWAAASARRTRCLGSPDRTTERCRNAAAAASPPRACARLADRSSSAATGSLGPAAAVARCHARRSGSTLRSVASARARWTSRRCSLVAVRYTAERTSGWRKVTRSLEGQQPVGFRINRRDRDPESLSSAPAAAADRRWALPPQAATDAAHRRRPR